MKWDGKEWREYGCSASNSSLLLLTPRYQSWTEEIQTFVICLWLVLPHAASSTSGRKIDLLLLFLTSHWQCVAAPSLELAIIFHLRKSIEKENPFWSVCILSIIQRHWYFTAAFFFFFSLQIMMWHQGRIQKQDGMVAGGTAKSSTFSCFPTDACSPPWLDSFVCFLTLPGCDLQNLLSIPQLSTALSTLGVDLHWAWLSHRLKVLCRANSKGWAIQKTYLFVPYQAK